MRFGVDVGGTTVKIGVCEDYKVVDTFVVKTTKENLFKDVCEGVVNYAKEHNGTIDFVGFGIPGVVIDNLIVNMPNIGLTNVNLNDVAKKYFPNAKIASTNDANAAALGEALVGEKSSSSYMVTLGTGVGGGYIIDDKVIAGPHAATGEIGHMYIDSKHEFQCNCGLKGCLETVASATGIVRLAKTYYNDYKTKLSKDTMSAKDVMDAAREGDALGLAVLDMVAEALGRALSIIAVTCDVDVFYIGGGVSAAGKVLLDAIKKYYNKYAFYALKNVRIELAKLGNAAGMISAAYLG
ncbi:glucokinase [Anaeroplasma bactoclasticum]|jgi:glucokinase|uniref:Glucokinase n=1 Tax=Anaeroplasma bactoclasticum TaxID=2088 RepID=A0A397QYF5_9MOLU|nr:ROK family protein [Anaeroplasma bactoclasticum]RIA64985.1 glucokinase [Anaeroplasma bactoclasticum]